MLCSRGARGREVAVLMIIVISSSGAAIIGRSHHEEARRLAGQAGDEPVLRFIFMDSNALFEPEVEWNLMKF